MRGFPLEVSDFKQWMKQMRSLALLLAILVVGLIGPQPAQARDAYSIMVEDQRAVVPLPRPVRRAKGSSSPSPVPPYRSTVTRPGVAPRAIDPYPIDRSGSPGGVVPGITTATGSPALTPPRPAGQTFQDRALGCLHAGSAQGVGAGQIGAYTGACVNQ